MKKAILALTMAFSNLCWAQNSNDPLLSFKGNGGQEFLIPKSVVNSVKIEKDHIRITLPNGNEMRSYKWSFILTGKLPTTVKSSTCSTNVASTCYITNSFFIENSFFLWTKHKDKNLVGLYATDDRFFTQNVIDYLSSENQLSASKYLNKNYAPRITCDKFSWLDESKSLIKINEVSFEAMVRNPETEVEENAVTAAIMGVTLKKSGSSTYTIVGVDNTPKDFFGLQTSPLIGLAYYNKGNFCSTSLEYDLGTLVREFEKSVKTPNVQASRPFRPELSSFSGGALGAIDRPDVRKIVSMLKDLDLIDYESTSQSKYTVKWVY